MNQKDSDLRSLRDAGPPFMRKGVERRLDRNDLNPFLLLFCAYLLAWFWQFSFRFPALQALRLELLIGSVLAIASVFSLARSPINLKNGAGAVAIAAFAFVVVVLTQVPFSVAGDSAWTTFNERVLKFGFMAIFIAAFVRSVRDLRWFIGAFLLAAGYLCFESVRGAFSGGMVWENQGIPRLHGVTPIFAHPNSLAGMAAGVLPFTLFLLPVAKSRFLKALLASLTVMALVTVTYTGSRAAYVAVIALGCFWLVRSRWRLTAKMGAILLAALTFLLLSPESYKARFDTIFTGQDIEGQSMMTRRQILEDATVIFLRHPLGVGVDGFSPVRQATFDRTQDTHNLYLQVATHLGVQGLVVFAWFIALLWRQLSRLGSLSGVRPSEADTEAIKWIVATASATQGYLFLRLVLGLFGTDLYEVYWWIITGLCVALTNIANANVNDIANLMRYGSVARHVALRRAGRIE